MHGLLPSATCLYIVLWQDTPKLSLIARESGRGASSPIAGPKANGWALSSYGRYFAPGNSTIEAVERLIMYPEILDAIRLKQETMN
jgi:hypothetical protein